jgi:hypothetical protein
MTPTSFVLDRAGEGARPREGATLVSVTRRLRPTLDPRLRQALDGKTKVVPNPRISAGSTVVISGPASSRTLSSPSETKAM